MNERRTKEKINFTTVFVGDIYYLYIFRQYFRGGGGGGGVNK